MIVINRLRVEYFQGVEAADCVLERGTTIIVGNNGSGKTTFWIDAILYLFYGISRRYGSQPGKKVVYRWWDGKPKPCCVVGYVDMHGQTIQIIRARGHPQYADGLTILDANGVDLSLGKTRDSQALLTRWLGMSSFTFRRSVMVESDVVGFPDAPEADRRRIIDDLLDIATLNEAHTELKKARTKQEAELAVLRERADGAIREFTSRMDDIVGFVAEEAGYHGQLVSDLAGVNASLRSAEEAVMAKQQASTQAAEHLQAARTASRTASQRVDDYNEAIADERERVSAEAARISAAREARAAAARSAAAEAARLNRMAGTVCHACRQPISKDHVLSMVEQIQPASDGDTSAEAAAEAAVAMATQELREADRLLREAMRTRDAATAAERTAQLAAQSATQELTLARQHVATLRTKLGELNAALTTNPYTEAVGRAMDRAAAAAQTIGAVHAECSRLEESVRRSLIMEECFGPHGARASMINAAVPFLNDAAASLQRRVHSRIGVRFETQDGALVSTVSNPCGAIDYDGSSRGERVKVDKIILYCLLMLARSRGSKTFGQSFYDEAIDGVDVEGRNMFEEMLLMAADGQHGCYIISHDRSVMADKADRIIHMEGGRIVTASES